MMQPTLFDATSTHGAVRATDPVSSLAGSRRACGTSQRETLVAACRACDALNARELRDRFLPDVELGVIRSRLAQLERDGRLFSMTWGDEPKRWYAHSRGTEDVPTGERL